MKYELRLMLRNEDGGCNTRGKWHVVFESDESTAKGTYLNLAYGNPRLAVFEYNESQERFVKIYQETK